MSVRLLSATLFLALAGSLAAWSQKPADLPQNVLDDCPNQQAPALVGQIIIVGNNRTPQDVILDKLALYSGAPLNYPDLRKAEANLVRLNVFETDPDRGVRPTVEVIDPDGPNPVKDVLVTVEEKSESPDEDDTKPKCGCAEKCACCGCKGAEEQSAEEKCACDACSCCGCCKKSSDKAAASTGCCATCPLCGHAGMPRIGWFIIAADCCPPLHWCVLCPVVNPEMAKLCRPCMQCAKVEYRKVMAAVLGAEAGAECGTVGEESTDATEHGCGHCGDASKKHSKAAHHGCPFGLDWALWKHGHAEKLAVMPCEVEMLTVMPKEKDATGDKPTVVCPYLRDRAAAKAPAIKPEEFPTILDNLAKLHEARRIFAKAEHHFRAGDYDAAERGYEKVMELCPGSRWDAEAQARRYAVAVLKMLQEQARSAVEEAEPADQAEPLPCEPEQCDDVNAAGMRQYKAEFIELLDAARAALDADDFPRAKELAQQAAALRTPDSGAEEASDLPAPDTCAKVAELIEAAQRAYAAGCHDEAQAFVNEALALDPDCPAAKTLQAQLNDELPGERCGEKCQTDDEDVPPGEQEPDQPPMSDEDPPRCPGLGLKHCLPPLDREMMEIIQRSMEEMVDGTGYRGIPRQRSFAEIGKWAQKAVDAFCEEMGIDVDLHSPRKPRGQVRLQLGGMAVCADVYSDGHGTLWFELCGHEKEQDLRDAQDTHNAKVLEWIEAMNSGGNIGGDDSEASEEPLFQLETDLDPDW
jgi:tetratricopeptide (TPR) repeat protein